MKLLPQFKKVDSNGLLESSLYDEIKFFKAFSSDLKNSRRSVVIESPFVTVRRSIEISKLLKPLLRSGVRITIYTRNPSHHDGSLVAESWQGIQILRKCGVKVVICNDLRHRKVAIIDGRILWEGSLNMLSQNCSKEIMRRTESEPLCKQMYEFIGVKWYSRY